jgi:hypothetical protein
VSDQPQSVDAMSDSHKNPGPDALRILHGARSRPPVEVVEALRPFLETMRGERSGDKLANASTAAVTELVRSLKENHAASNDLWEEAIEATLSFANEAACVADIDKPGGWMLRASMPGGLARTFYVYELDDNKAAELAKAAVAVTIGETVETVKLLNTHELTGYGMRPGDVKQYV